MISGVLGAALLGVGLAASGTAAAAPAAGFDRLVVFGDSLSDNGNAGRFSNGPVWVEQLAERLGLPLMPARMGGTNFAVGGARLDPRSGPFSLRAQADLFLALPRARGRALHVVYGGGNDLLGAVGSPEGEAAVDAALASLRGILRDLVERGARDILVPNLPDVGLTPAVRAYGEQAVERAGRLTERFNAGIDRMAAELAPVPGLRLYRLDVRAMADRARDEPGAYGFVDFATPCGELEDCEGHVFWDPVHPTTQAHGRLAEAAYRLVGDGAAGP
jgi:outer membrane lipase/esterase